MEERKLTSLVFGNVVLESQMLGVTPRVYAEDIHSYSFHPDPQVSLPIPLDDLKGQLEHDHAEALADKVLDSVCLELDANYPGGFEPAKQELST